MAPIYNLDHNVLWSILNTITDCFPIEPKSNSSIYSPLTTLRHVSQVCGDWRDLSLHSSLLWGKVVDLAALEMCTEKWRQEVIHRTGDSLLWIQGPVTRLSAPFFFSVLNEHWGRIERISVSVNTYTGRGVELAQNWGPLLLRSPHLRQICISHPQNLSSISENSLLFANNAPLLRICGISNLRFDPQSPWLVNLRSLSMKTGLSILEMLGALKSTRVLQYLDITLRLDNPATVSTIPKIDLPYLHTFRIHGLHEECSPFLKSITPASGCSFKFWIRLKPSSHLADTDVSAMNRRLVRFSHNYLREHAPQQISLQYYKNAVLRFEVDKAESHYLRLLTELGYVGSLAPLFQEFCQSSYFSSVKRLEIELEGTMSPGYVMSLVKFVIRLPNITVLSSNTATLWSLLNNPISETIVPFLTVETVILKDLKSPREVVLPALKILLHAGAPLSTLDLTEIPSNNLIAIDCLDELKGLRVKWKDTEGVKESVCGTGFPKTLLTGDI
ncbi:hypothetical protein GALMADRAFT_258485 [Galerina marginata CBS 339.88]|uniref:F-box domain-containing protein n=1 Tax=Galerina marginata (strain CBS 339.88) TaxID=685588 RepID=A0A067SH87_GALM3|nr:hypothetical protein GALMADRAFT_258485 [Galerina marginata CBS 339.88]